MRTKNFYRLDAWLMGYFDIERYLISQFNGKFLLWFRRQKWGEVSSLPWLSSWWCWLLTVVCAGCSQAGGWGQTGRPYCSPSLRSPPSAIITVSLSLLTIISSPLCFPYLREPSCYKVMKCTFYLSESLVTSLAVIHSVCYQETLQCPLWVRCLSCPAVVSTHSSCKSKLSRFINSVASKFSLWWIIQTSLVGLLV